MGPNMMPPPTAIILVNWNTRDLLRQALRSVREHAGMPVHVIVVDNASSDGSPEMVRAEFPEATLIANPDNRGFGQANNQGFAASREPFILLLNSDAELTPGALPALVAELERHAEAGAVGGRLVYPDGRFQASFNRFPRLWHEALALAGLARYVLGTHYPSASEAQSRQLCPVDWVGGAAMLLRRRALHALGGSMGFDPDYHMYSEEMDLCRRLHGAGWPIRYTPSAVFIHHAGQSTGQRPLAQPLLLWESRLRYYRKHHPVYQARLLATMIRAGYRIRAIAWGMCGRVATKSKRSMWLSRADAARALVRNL